MAFKILCQIGPFVVLFLGAISDCNMGFLQWHALAGTLQQHFHCITRCNLATYLQVSHFSFPFATIVHECAVHNEGKYVTTHEVIRKNLKRNGQETLKEVAKWAIPENIFPYTVGGFFSNSRVRVCVCVEGGGGGVELKTRRHSRFVFY